MTEPKKAVGGKQAGNPPSRAKKQTAGSAQKKPVPPKTQVKSSAAKSPAKSSPPAPQARSTSSDSAKLKENAARAEALENRNILLPEEKDISNSATEPSDVTGVIVPADREELKPTEPARGALPVDKEDSGQSKSDEKHKKKDKTKLLKTGDSVSKGENKEDGKPKKDKDTLLQKTAKAEKKVNKLKKKVHKAEKKEVKKSKLRILKEKLTKAFSKWQRRKKKLDDTDK